MATNLFNPKCVREGGILLLFLFCIEGKGDARSLVDMHRKWSETLNPEDFVLFIVSPCCFRIEAVRHIRVKPG